MSGLRLLDRVHRLISLRHQLGVLCWNALISLGILNRPFILHDMGIVLVKRLCPDLSLDEFGGAFGHLLVRQAFDLLLWRLESSHRLLLLWFLILLLFLASESIRCDIVLTLIGRIVPGQGHAPVCRP